jgi:hypothetical protein
MNDVAFAAGPIVIATMSRQQKWFAALLGRFLMEIYKNPRYAVVVGEIKRTPEMQALYLQRGATKAAHSKHQDSLAVDLALFIDDVYQTKTEAYADLGAIWKSLDPSNVWGGDWVTIHDGNHFQYGA